MAVGKLIVIVIAWFSVPLQAQNTRWWRATDLQRAKAQVCGMSELLPCHQLDPLPTSSRGCS